MYIYIYICATYCVHITCIYIYIYIYYIHIIIRGVEFKGFVEVQALCLVIVGEIVVKFPCIYIYIYIYIYREREREREIRAACSARSFCMSRPARAHLRESTEVGIQGG